MQGEERRVCFFLPVAAAKAGVSAECAAMADEIVYLVDGLRIDGNGGPRASLQVAN